MRGFGSPGSRRAQPLVAGLRAGALHRARAGRRSDDAGVNGHVRGQGIAAAGSWHGAKGAGGFSRRAVHKKGEMTAAVGRYPSTGRRGQSGGMHRRPVGAVGPAVCTDGPAGAVGLTRVVCRGAPEGAVGWYAPTTGGGSRTDGPGGEVGRYASTGPDGPARAVVLVCKYWLYRWSHRGCPRAPQAFRLVWAVKWLLFSSSLSSPNVSRRLAFDHTHNFGLLGHVIHPPDDKCLHAIKLEDFFDLHSQQDAKFSRIAGCKIAAGGPQNHVKSGKGGALNDIIGFLHSCFPDS